MADRSFRILIFKESGVNVNIEDDLAEWQRYEREKIGFSLEYEIRPIRVEKILHKPFGITGKESGKQVELYGLDGIKPIIREHVAEGMYDFVIFLYDIKDSELYKNKKTRSLADRVRHWCYFEPLFPGTPFSEIMTKSTWKELDTFRVFSHEHRHGLCNRLRALGHPVPDVMDTTYIAPNTPVDYYKEHEPWAPDGNRAIQNILLKPYLDTLAARPEVLSFIERLKRLIADLQAKMKDMNKPIDTSRIVLWAEATKKHEGWYVGSRSYRNNNPGNFKTSGISSYMKSLGSIGQDKDGFHIFPTYAKGWDALLQFLRDAKANDLIPYRNFATRRDATLRAAHKPEGPKDAKGRSVSTLYDFYQVYAPTGDNVVPGFTNDPNAYANEVAAYLGVDVSLPVDKV